MTRGVADGEDDMTIYAVDAPRTLRTQVTFADHLRNAMHDVKAAQVAADTPLQVDQARELVARIEQILRSTPHD